MVHRTVSPFQGTSESSSLKIVRVSVVSSVTWRSVSFFNFSIYAGKQRWTVCKVRRSQTEDYLIYRRPFATCLGFTASLLLGFLPFVWNISEWVKKVMYLNCLLMGSVNCYQTPSSASALLQVNMDFFLLNPMCILSSKALKRWIRLVSYFFPLLCKFRTPICYCPVNTSYACLAELQLKLADFQQRYPFLFEILFYNVVTTSLQKDVRFVMYTVQYQAYPLNYTQKKFPSVFLHVTLALS